MVRAKNYKYTCFRTLTRLLSLFFSPSQLATVGSMSSSAEAVYHNNRDREEDATPELCVPKTIPIALKLVNCLL